jgi:hypothetical protein
MVSTASQKAKAHKASLCSKKEHKKRVTTVSNTVASVGRGKQSTSIRIRGDALHGCAQ